MIYYTDALIWLNDPFFAFNQMKDAALILIDPSISDDWTIPFFF